MRPDTTRRAFSQDRARGKTGEGAALQIWILGSSGGESVDTQFVGAPRQIADQLERLRDTTAADELIITHDHPRPRRPGPLLPVARRRMGQAMSPG